MTTHKSWTRTDLQKNNHRLGRLTTISGCVSRLIAVVDVISVTWSPKSSLCITCISRTYFQHTHSTILVKIQCPTFLLQALCSTFFFLLWWHTEKWIESVVCQNCLFVHLNRSHITFHYRCSNRDVLQRYNIANITNIYMAFFALRSVKLNCIAWIVVVVKFSSSNDIQ